MLATGRRKEEDIYNPIVRSKGLEFLVDHSEEERERGQSKAFFYSRSSFNSRFTALKEHIIFCNTSDHSVALIDIPGNTQHPHLHNSS